MAILHAFVAPPEQCDWNAAFKRESYMKAVIGVSKRSVVQITLSSETSLLLAKRTVF